jgi:hypothetical protein
MAKVGNQKLPVSSVSILLPIIMKVKMTMMMVTEGLQLIMGSGPRG